MLDVSVQQQREAMVVMRLSSDNGRWMLKGLGGLGTAVLVAAACAGGDTPPRSDELERELIDRYDNAVGQAGGVSMSGSGGSGQGGSGQGGSASTNAGSGGSVSSTGGSTGGGAAGAGSGGAVCDAPGTILVAKCGASTCHGSGSAQGAFAADANAAATFVGTVSSRGATCGSFINAADPDKSLLLTMVTGEAGTNCSQLPMPLPGDALTPTEEDCLSDWLSQF